MRGVFIALIVAGLGLVGAPKAVAQPLRKVEIDIERRGGLDDLTGILMSMDERGVRIDSARLGERLVTWDRIRGVRGAGHPRLPAWIADGTMIWRARIRLGRGDPLTAEPLLDDLAERYLGRTDELALIVFEGLLRCRIARGAHDRAMEPLLETIRLRSSGVRTQAFVALPPVIDEQYGLAPSIAPVWHGDADVAAIARRLAESRRRLESLAASEPFSDAQRGGAARAAAVAACYLFVARQSAGGPPVSIPDPGDDPGLELLRSCIADSGGSGDPGSTGDAGDGDGESGPVDPEAILEAGRNGENRPGWVVNWNDFFRGLRALESTDPTEADRGLVDLLRIPALSAVERPYLAGVALARVIDHLDRNGRTDAAAILRDDLAARFRGHPDAPAGRSGRTEFVDP